MVFNEILNRINKNELILPDFQRGLGCRKNEEIICKCSCKDSNWKYSYS